MKKTFVLAFVLFACLCAVSCNKSPTSPKNPLGVTIKGNFTGGVNAQGFSISGFIAALLGETNLYALDYTLVKKVAVITNNSYNLFDVASGGFQVNAPEGLPAGLIFIGETGNYLGYLTLGGGIESLPLNMLDSNTGTIDLKTLSSSGTIVEPGHNPIGSEISMTASDLSSYAFSNGPLGEALKSPDADGDGIVDIVNGKFYTYTMTYCVNGGNFGSGLTPVFSAPVAATAYRLGIKIFDTDKNFPASINFYGAAGSGIESTPSAVCLGDQDDMKTYYSPYISSPMIPPAGIYTVTYKTKTLTFNIASQAAFTQYLVIPVPTVFLNPDNTINKITWVYKLSDGSTSVDPASVLADVSFSVGVTYVPYIAYTAPILDRSVTSHTLTKQSIAWSDVVNISMSCHDIFGNMVGVQWNKP